MSKTLQREVEDLREQCNRYRMNMNHLIGQINNLTNERDDYWRKRRWESAKDNVAATIAGLKAQFGDEEININAVVRNSIKFADVLIEEFRKDEVKPEHGRNSS